MLGKIFATVVFEFRNSLTTSRLATGLILVLFSPVMLLLIGLFFDFGAGTGQIPFPLLIIGVFHLLAIFLAVLLWATPVVFSELEGKTWTYLAIRPNGKFASTVGKFINAVMWATLTSALSLGLSCLVVDRFFWDPVDVIPYKIVDNPDMLLEWMSPLLDSSVPYVILYSLAPVILLGSLALSAIFIHIGLIAHKRGMVFAVIYVIVETVFAFLPAVVRQFTVGFHLRNIGFKLSGFDYPMFEMSILVDESAVWVHMLALVIIAAVHFAASLYWLHTREYITVEEA